MQQPSRRQFVVSTLSGLPLLAYAGPAAAAPTLGLQRESRAPGARRDPVWEQIHADLARVYGEVRASARRADTHRAFESTLRLHAAYSLATGNAARIASAVAERVRAGGRAQLVAEAVEAGRAHHREAELRKYVGEVDRTVGGRRDLTPEGVERAIDAILSGGYVPALRALADVEGRLAAQFAAPAAPGPVIAAARLQQDALCTQMESAIEILRAITGIVCGMVVAFPALAAECAALGVTLGVLELEYWIICTWWR